MMGNEINSLSEIDVTALTFANIRLRYRTFRNRSEGKRRNKKYFPRNGCRTEIGDIRLDIWLRLAELMVKQAGEEELLERLIEHVKAWAWMKNSPGAKILEHALELHMARIFDNPSWVSFIPFNEGFRPEALAGVKIIDVIPACCRIPGRVTEQQLDCSTINPTVCCPYCGRQIEYRIVEER